MYVRVNQWRGASVRDVYNFINFVSCVLRRKGKHIFYICVVYQICDTTGVSRGGAKGACAPCGSKVKTVKSACFWPIFIWFHDSARHKHPVSMESCIHQWIHSHKTRDKRHFGYHCEEHTFSFNLIPKSSSYSYFTLGDVAICI